MRGARILIAALAALAATGCARQQQTYVIDTATGQPVPVVMQQQFAAPQYAQQTYQQPAPPAAASGERGLFNSWQSAPQPQYGQPAYQQPAPSGRGLFGSQQSAPPVYVQPSSMVQYSAPQPQQYAPPQYAPPPRTGGPYAPAPNGFASASLY